MKALSRLQDGRWERGMIRRIGEMLGFQAESGAAAIHLAFFAMNGSIQEVAAIELHAGFGSPHFHCPATVRLVNFRRQGERMLAFRIQDPVVIVASAEFQLLVVLVDPRPYGFGMRK